MAKIYPFRALRYDPTRVELEDVVTQPYDKITPEMQQAYYDRSPYNLIRVILGKKEPTDGDAHNVYTRAAQTLASYRAEGILKEESEPALYGYSQTYQVPGSEEIRERRGFIALGHLYDYADHVVYRHEQTFPKHKSDRLALFKATRAYCEQIYMLYSDPAFTAEKLIFGTDEMGTVTPADLAITDEYGVVHRVWKLTDPTLINLILTAMADKKLIIADGHHRYETSVSYSKERAAELGHKPETVEHEDPLDPMDESPSNRADEGHAILPKPPYPEAAMMMTFVNMEAPGITILPTHRVVFGLPDFSPQAFLTAAEPFFDIVPAIGHSVDQLTGTEGTAMLAVSRDPKTGDLYHHLLKAKPEAMARALADLSPRKAQLDVVQLHRILLEGVLGLSHESIARLDNIRYIRSADEAAEQVEQGEADIAFLIKPVTLQQFKDISLNLEVMPQKSTDFYPKLLSGLAIYALD
jgi:uncharacterized protein (DUF1015 family)